MILSVEHLHKTFRDFWHRPVTNAVNDLSFQINEGEVFGLLGPNGSGKSTTIKMILGLLRADHGTISIAGAKANSKAAHACIGYLPEITYLHPFLTPYETLSYYGSLFDIPALELKKRIGDLLELVGLKDAAHRKVGAFSKGMTRRVGLAQSLINAPRLLIFDEPTSGLDPIGTREVKDLILALKKRGITVLMTSHLLADVQDCCDRVLIMQNGFMRAQGTIQDLHTSLETFFLNALDSTSTPPSLDAIDWLANK